MSLRAKICGLTTPEAVKAAVRAGASYIGFVFYEKSPRNISPKRAAELAAKIPASVTICGVFVNPSDEQLKATLDHISLNLIQLHGQESPQRCQEIKNRFKRPVMKAIAVTTAEDIAVAKAYENTADILLFDAKPAADQKEALPGGNGLRFDWHLMKGQQWNMPWMLSGGLDADNLEAAAAISGAAIFDVSSGVENHPGAKSIPKINAFMTIITKDNI
ncbi:Phosphoribosylanthranilate isomerase [hydrothermal vent metagenome]|uniref:phosphoribosylanthranilate isomerase n=1 Tax=hydrothermal vent metagenome TaxID=652676 RepID=A0A3B1AG94_9ZZZZ